MNVRQYKESDFPLIKSWWEEAGEPAPLATMVPTDSSFILEMGGKPILSISLILTNITEYAWLENFISAPQTKNENRKKASTVLLSFVEKEAKRRGYKRLICMSEKDKLKGRYKELGYHETLSGVSTFVKEI